MGADCSRVSETECPGYHCDGLERCYSCWGGIGDMSDVNQVGCWVASELLFLAIIFPLIIFFAIIGVYVLHKSRIRQSTSINLCVKSMDGRQWGITIMYLLFELAVLLDIYFWILAGIGAPNYRVDGVILGIFFFILASCFACCGCCKYSRPPQEQAPVSMGVAVVPASSVSFHAAPVSVSVVSGQAPMSGGYYPALAAPVAAGAPSQVGQPATTATAGDGVYTAAPLTVGAAPSQVGHGSGGSYRPPPYSPASTAASTAAPRKEDFRV